MASLQTSINLEKGHILIDLFSDIPDNACPAYLNLRAAANEHSKAGREHCEDLWRDFKDYADHPFLSGFPLNLHQWWFEMYLTVALIRAGYDVQCPRPNGGGPDILLTVDKRRIWIEATCASAGEAELPNSVPVPPIPKPDEPPVVTERPTNNMILRITNSLDVKQKKFKKWIEKGIVEPTDVTVIAINVHGIPGAWADMTELMRRALYGRGDIQLRIDPEANAIIDQWHTHQPTITKTKMDSSVCLQPFVDGSLPHISAVLGSGEDIVNFPPRLGDGFTLFPNVTATTSWLVGTIRLGEEFVYESDTMQLTKVSYIT